MKLPLSRIAEFVGASGVFPREAIASGYSIDSRSIQSGDLFFAVQGERLDGHDFVEQALDRGAVAAVINKDQAHRYRGPCLKVEDTLGSLQALAASVRQLWNKALIGITGSAGKTTTKEAVAHVLSTKYKVLKSEGNFNNHFGLPLMLLKLETDYDIAVIEMGMSHAGEIAALARIAVPNVGVVTNVAPVHLEHFDSVAGIARAKYELIESLPADGTAVLNADDEYVSHFGKDFRGRILTYGVHISADVRAANIETHGADGSQFDVIAGGMTVRATLGLVGTHNIHNALAAITVGLDRGISLNDACAALASLRPADKRGEVIRFGNITIINDCYNSNPTALAAMVDALAAMAGTRRIVVAGEMLELGSAAQEMHRQAGESMARKKKVDILIGVRGLAQPMVDAANAAGLQATFIDTPEAAGDWLSRNTRDGDVVLLKASRGVKLEQALETWKAQARHHNAQAT
jgi:UDP-N-acetylmuramoyl-tripeptide--D-alanyl-D-alanine ligase